MRRDRLLYISYQILDEQKRMYAQGIPSLKRAQIELESMASFIQKRDNVPVERIDANSVKIDGKLFYIFNSTPRAQW